MDIPNTGAIFTLGKSHLAENTQSYFYIKNDPVKRLTSGANQSAVICESGRLFVWGENHFGQLGVGTSSSGHSDIITKPTCVKSLKTLGLKIADIAFGNGWAVILTHSNEVFFTGRNIFSAGTKVTENFSSATVGTEKCSIIRKPFRLENFDSCLSTSEDQEDFTCISAGNEHFAVMTSLGRLIGWGSNEHHQLGSNNANLDEPYEIALESKVKQFVCGPTSTLILTESGSLYLTGRLSEFAFTQFTELQKNLATQEEIIFMHISQASEMYIVTNEGGIYRSMESMRHNSLIFQRFYDYDSEENGQIVKLLRGTSFYAALTKANKFYTTFSESGHHLKTFREISKFKNLRALDMVVGDQHILVHGIPRSANKLLNKTFVVRPDSNANIHQVAGQSRLLEDHISEEAEENGNNDETVKQNTPVHELVDEVTHVKEIPEVREELKESLEVVKKEDKPEMKSELKEKVDEQPPPSASSSKDLDAIDASPTSSLKSSRYIKMEESETESNNSSPSKKTILTANADSSSPTSSVKSRKGSARSIRFDESSLVKQNSVERIVRPRTPFPEDIPPVPIDVLIGEEDTLDKTSPALNDSLENIPSSVLESMIGDLQREDSGKSKASTKKRKLTPMHRNTDPVLSSEEDEQLAVEISSTDYLNKTVVNEIRFINNGVDVTENISKKILPKIDSVGSAIEDEAEAAVDAADSSTKNVVEAVVEDASKKGEQTLEKTDKAAVAAQSTFGKVSSSLHSAAEKVTSGVGNAAENTFGKVSDTMHLAAAGVGNAAGNTFGKVSDTMHSVTSGVGNAAENTFGKVSDTMHSAAAGVGSAAGNTFGKVSDTMHSAAAKVSSEVDNAMGVVSSKFDSAVSSISEGVDNTVSTVSHTMSNTVDKISGKVDDAKQNLSELFAGGHTPNSNSGVTTDEISTPKDSSKIDDDERTTASVNSNLSARGNPFENDNEQTFETVKQSLGDEIRSTGEAGKGKVKQFFSDMKAKGKGMSCRDEKALRIEDEPPKYTPVDELADETNKTSKVCTIL